MEGGDAARSDTRGEAVGIGEAEEKNTLTPKDMESDDVFEDTIAMLIDACPESPACPQASQDPIKSGDSLYRLEDYKNP